MSSERAGCRAAESWGLDEELEQTERMTELWERHAELHHGTAYGEAITKVARGYRLQLEALREAREMCGPDAKSDPSCTFRTMPFTRALESKG